VANEVNVTKNDHFSKPFKVHNDSLVKTAYANEAFLNHAYVN